MRQRKHFVQWLAVTALYWMVAYAVANLVSYVYYVLDSFSQPAGIWNNISLLYSNFMWSFVFNQFWDIDLIVILPAGVVWVLFSSVSRHLYLRIAVVALWSSLVVLCLYLVNGILISLHSFQESYYELFFARHLVSSIFSTTLLERLLRA